MMMTALILHRRTLIHCPELHEVLCSQTPCQRVFGTHAVVERLTFPLQLLIVVAHTRVGDVRLPVVVAEQAAALELNTGGEEEDI